MGKGATSVGCLPDAAPHTLQPLGMGSCLVQDKARGPWRRLKADIDGPNWPDQQITEAFEVEVSTLEAWPFPPADARVKRTRPSPMLKPVRHKKIKPWRQAMPF
jgi:hypothetical protein